MESHILPFVVQLLGSNGGMTLANLSTKISWTDVTWSPLTGCTKVSPGCRNCYAETLDKRFHRDGPYVPWTVAAQRKAGVSAIHLHPERLAAPLHWKKPRRIFVNSMSDLFHEDVPDEFIDRVFAVMALAPQHVFQVLTKRPERMLSYLQGGARFRAMNFAMVLCVEAYQRSALSMLGDGLLIDVYGFVEWPLPNVWLGVSVENQRYADERLPLLAQCPAAVRFVSAEPLLGPVDLANWQPNNDSDACEEMDSIAIESQGILDWVIIGGESGPHHRPMQVEWAQSIVEQCAKAKVPVWMKQDSGPRPGQQGRLPDSLWALKQMPGGKP